VSRGGGTVPRWSLNGQEIAFLSPRDGGIMSARVQPAGDGLKFTTPDRLFDAGFIGWGHSAPYLGFAVTSDGQRFMVPVATSSVDVVTSLTVVLNWAEKILKP
jgi:hypothetical protein